MNHPLKVNVSGVRGIIGENLTPPNILTLAQAFGTLIGPGPVVIGRDTRLSGPMMEHTIIAGLIAVGCRPLLAGIIPTPTVLILTEMLQAGGGIAITASHNPASWNAMKFVEPNGLFLNQHRAEELSQLCEQKIFPWVKEADLLGVETIQDPMQEHYRRILNYVNAEGIKKKRFKVAIDCCNGVGALHTPAFLHDHFGCEVVPLFDQADGVFEREPEPTSENLASLKQAVIEHGCDLGFAQDPDGDRLAIVDETGRAIGEDLTLAIAVEQVLNRHRKTPVVINLSTSKSVERVAQRHGSKVTRTKIGEINVTESMLEQDAAVGGEGNGGVIIPEIHPCRDSYTGMAIVLEHLLDTGKTVSQSCAEIPTYCMIKEKKTIPSEKFTKILEKLYQHYAKEQPNTLDGIYIDFGESCAHVRPSNTEPVLRVSTEAPTHKEAERLCRELHNIIDEAGR